MKLRIRGNSVRLRLTRTDVDKLDADGRVDESVDFGAGNLMFRYALETANRQDVSAEFDGSAITVFIPREKARAWANSEQVGIESEPGAGLRILIEKDFACLHERAGEPDDDAFRNLEPENRNTV